MTTTRTVNGQTIFPSATITSTTTSAPMEIDSDRFSGMLFLLSITAASGTPSVTIKIQYIEPISGTAIDVPGGAFAAKTGVSTASLLIHPSATASANVAVAQALVGNYQAVATVSGGTPSLTLSLIGIPVK